VIVACVAGKNRSVAMERALTLNPHRKPSCDAMERAALGYLRDKDVSIVPLFPQPSKRKRGDELLPAYHPLEPQTKDSGGGAFYLNAKEAPWDEQKEWYRWDCPDPSK